MKVALKEVSIDNWFECTKLDVTVEQKEHFSCPVVYWLAESKFLPHFNPMGVYDGDSLVGFLVYGLDADDNQYWLMAFMIDRHSQGLGYGRAAMHEFVRYVRETHGCAQIRP